MANNIEPDHQVFLSTIKIITNSHVKLFQKISYYILSFQDKKEISVLTLAISCGNNNDKSSDKRYVNKRLTKSLVYFY